MDLGRDHGYFFKWGQGILTIRVEAPLDRIKGVRVNGASEAYDREKGIYLQERLSARESNSVVFS